MAKVNTLPPSPGQRRKALAVLVSAYRTSGPPDAPDGRTWINKETEAEFEAYLAAFGRILDIPPEAFWEIPVDEVIAATLAEDAAAAEAPPKRGRGRPPTPHKHARITCTIEAYIGACLTRVDAIERAAEKWLLAETTIDKIYRDNKPFAPDSKTLRDLFGNGTTEEIDAAIKQFREAEKLERE